MHRTILLQNFSSQVRPVLKLQGVQVGKMSQQNENFRNLTMVPQIVSYSFSTASNQPKLFHNLLDEVNSDFLALGSFVVAPLCLEIKCLHQTPNFY
jgi:hypothetical protein